MPGPRSTQESPDCASVWPAWQTVHSLGREERGEEERGEEERGKEPAWAGKGEISEGGRGGENAMGKKGTW